MSTLEEWIIGMIMDSQAITDKDGSLIRVRDMIRVHGKYEDDLGIVTAIYLSGLVIYQPIGRESTPIGTHAKLCTVVTEADFSEVRQ